MLLAVLVALAAGALWHCRWPIASLHPFIPFAGGLLQIVLTMALAALAALAAGAAVPQGAFVGALLSMSSTSIVVKCLDKAERSSLYGQITIGTLLLQGARPARKRLLNSRNVRSACYTTGVVVPLSLNGQPLCAAWLKTESGTLGMLLRCTITSSVSWYAALPYPRLTARGS